MTTVAVQPMLPFRIAGTASLAPGRLWTTAAIAAQVDPPRDAAEVEARTGIQTRRFADPDDHKAAVGARVLRAALDAANLGAADLERLIFVNSHGGDVLVPATANRVAGALQIPATCDCFDLNNSCMGFLTALDLAGRCIATGCGPVGIVVSEQGSRFVTPLDPRPFLVAGDAAAAAVLVPSRGGAEAGGILATWLRNDGRVEGEVTLGHAGLTGRPETVRFGKSNAEISALAIGSIQEATRHIVERTGIPLDGIEWFVPHQPNGSLLDRIVATLGLDRSRLVPVVQEIGSVGAAAMPFSLDRLLRTKDVRPGDRILLVGVGAGLAYGAILLRVGT